MQGHIHLQLKPSSTWNDHGSLFLTSDAADLFETG